MVANMILFVYKIPETFLVMRQVIVEYKLVFGMIIILNLISCKLPTFHGIQLNYLAHQTDTGKTSELSRQKKN